MHLDLHLGALIISNFRPLFGPVFRGHYKPGWNVISFTYLPDNKAVSNVLSTLVYGTDYDQVSTWESGAWKHWVNDTDFNDFTEFQRGKTYEIYNKKATDVTFSVTGKSSGPNISHSIASGDNFISPAVKTATNVTTVLSGLTLGTHYSDVKRFNATSQTWESYAGSAFTQFEPGKGYNIIGLTTANFSYGNTQQTTTMVYDSTGSRVKKTAGSTTTIYLGKDYEVEGSTSTKYVFLGDRRISSKTSGGTIYFIHSDHIDSSNILTDSSGNQAALIEFDPYGSTVTLTGSASFRHKFTGKEEDSSSALYYYEARYYDPQIGRFITADPTVSEPDNPQELNRYTYAGNNPIKYNDPTGLKKKGGFWRSFFKILTIVLIVVAVIFAVYAAIGLLGGLGGVGGGSGGAFSEVLTKTSIELAGASAGGGGLSAGGASAIAAVSGSAGIVSAQFSQGVSPNSIGASIHHAQNPDWMNRLVDAPARGPQPNLNPNSSSGGPGSITPGANGEGVPAVSSAPYMVNQVFDISQTTFYNKNGSEAKNKGRAGKQKRLKQIANDPNTPKWIRGFLNNFFKQKGRYKLPGNEPRSTAYELAHRRGFEARKGYDYSYAELQETGLHKAQHAIERENS